MKYIDMYTAFKGDETFDMTETELIGAKVAFQWIDHNLEQVPGRTITQSDLIAAVDETNHEDMNEYQKARALLVHLGYTIPKPTNAELLEALLEGGDINAQWGLRGGGVMFARELAHALDKAGVRAAGDGE